MAQWTKARGLQYHRAMGSILSYVTFFLYYLVRYSARTIRIESVLGIRVLVGMLGLHSDSARTLLGLGIGNLAGHCAKKNPSKVLVKS